MSDKAVFLDRDDTLIWDPGYINDPDQVRLIDGVPEALIALSKIGYKLIVVSNQSAVARGIVTEKVLGRIHDRLEELLGEKGASLDGIYYCPYHPDGSVPRYRKESDCRKPKPGMLLAAADEMDIDLDESWMIGNSGRDVEAGARAGCRTILVDPPNHEVNPEDLKSNPDYRAINLKEATNLIRQHQRLGMKKASEPAPPETDQEPETSAPTVQTDEPVEEPAQEEPETEERAEKPEAQVETARVDSPTTEQSVSEEPPAAVATEEQKEISEPAEQPGQNDESDSPVRIPPSPQHAESREPRPIRIDEQPPRRSREITKPVEADPVVQKEREPTSGVETDDEASDEEAVDGADADRVEIEQDKTTRQLLEDILEQLKMLNRYEIFDEFSAMRFLAGVIQILVLFCIVITAWLLLNAGSSDPRVSTALMFAVVLQLMALTFYIMQGRK